LSLVRERISPVGTKIQRQDRKEREFPHYDLEGMIATRFTRMNERSPILRLPPIRVIRGSIVLSRSLLIFLALSCIPTASARAGTIQDPDYHFKFDLPNGFEPPDREALKQLATRSAPIVVTDAFGTPEGVTVIVRVDKPIQGPPQEIVEDVRHGLEAAQVQRYGKVSAGNSVEWDDRRKAVVLGVESNERADRSYSFVGRQNTVTLDFTFPLGDENKQRLLQQAESMADSFQFGAGFEYSPSAQPGSNPGENQIWPDWIDRTVQWLGGMAVLFVIMKRISRRRKPLSTTATEGANADIPD
jgi:hypothetical protein